MGVASDVGGDPDFHCTVARTGSCERERERFSSVEEDAWKVQANPIVQLLPLRIYTMRKKAIKCWKIYFGIAHSRIDILCFSHLQAFRAIAILIPEYLVEKD